MARVGGGRLEGRRRRKLRLGKTGLRSGRHLDLGRDRAPADSGWIRRSRRGRLLLPRRLRRSLLGGRRAEMRRLLEALDARHPRAGRWSRRGLGRTQRGGLGLLHRLGANAPGGSRQLLAHPLELGRHLWMRPGPLQYFQGGVRLMEDVQGQPAVRDQRLRPERVVRPGMDRPLVEIRRFRVLFLLLAIGGQGQQAPHRRGHVRVGASMLFQCRQSPLHVPRGHVGADQPAGLSAGGVGVALLGIGANEGGARLDVVRALLEQGHQAMDASVHVAPIQHSQGGGQLLRGAPAGLLRDGGGEDLLLKTTQPDDERDHRSEEEAANVRPHGDARPPYQTWPWKIAGAARTEARHRPALRTRPGR